MSAFSRTRCAVSGILGDIEGDHPLLAPATLPVADPSTKPSGAVCSPMWIGPLCSWRTRVSNSGSGLLTAIVAGLFDGRHHTCFGLMESGI